MDHTPAKERDIVIDIDGCLNSGKEVVNLDILDDQLRKMVSFTVCGVPMAADELANGHSEVSLPSCVKHAGDVPSDSGKNAKKDNRKPMSAKKPPRPPRALSLYAADQKLIKEISELAMIKRARAERLKGLKKMKAGKASSSSSISASSSGNVVALLFTVLFCVVIVFQGCRSSGTSPGNTSGIRIHGPSESNMDTKPASPSSKAPPTSSASSYLTEALPGSDTGTSSAF